MTAVVLIGLVVCVQHCLCKMESKGHDSGRASMRDWVWFDVVWCACSC